MRGAKSWAIAGAMTLASAADAAEPPLYQPPPPMLQPICVPRAQAHLWPGVPICLEEFSQWYLRGDIGMTNQKVKELDNFLYAGNTIQAVGHDFTSSMLFGLGFGLAFNEWLRFDFTGEFRGKSEFQGLDIVNTSFTDEYRAKKWEWLILANGYVDLGTWWCITPFVGAGLGFSRVTFGSFLDVGTVNQSVAFADTASQWNFAWALHAGLAYQASPTWTVELAYRYVSLGDGITGDIVTFNGVNQFNNPMHFKDITSHDLKLGLRWVCCEPEPLPPPPPVVYQPPPVYAPPPPIMRKG